MRPSGIVRPGRCPAGELLDQAILGEYNSRGVLGTERSRAEFVPPDLQ
jgi:hypothetical protein